MSDTVLTIAVTAVDLGIVVGLIALLVLRRDLRMHTVVVLGSLTPAVVFYGWVVVAYLADPKDPSNRFAFFAGPIMTFGMFVMLIVWGLVLSVVPWLRPLFARYALACAAACGCCALLLTLAR